MSVQSGLRVTTITTWNDTGLFARADLYDNTTGTPVLLTTIPMTEFLTGTYQASFIPVAGKDYAVVKRVFTDGTYATVDTNYSGTSESFQCIDFAMAGAGVVATPVSGSVVITNTLSSNPGELILGVEIVQTRQIVFNVKLRDANDDPYDLTPVTAISICFTNADGTDLVLSLSAGISVVGNPVLGVVQVALTAAQTNLLDLVDSATLELALITTGDPVAVLIPGAYDVVGSQC